MISKYILESMEWIGTVVFSVFGPIVAISHGLDLFGVIIVGCLCVTIVIRLLAAK